MLEARNLRIAFPVPNGPAFEAVRGISFTVGAERVALVGESGSGKTLTARALMGLVPRSAKVSADRLTLDDTDLLSLSAGQWRAIRGAQVGLVLQDPRFALNPLHTIGRQVEEPLKLHQRLSRGERRERALSMMERVGLDNPREVYGLYPGQLSGGMGQRAMIAAMLIAQPRFLVADEPTSALDENLRRQILELLADLAAKEDMGLLLISHDLQQVADFTDRTLVIYRGQLVDEQKSAELSRSSHPYTRTLWACRPSAASYGARLPTLRRDEIEATL